MDPLSDVLSLLKPQSYLTARFLSRRVRAFMEWIEEVLTPYLE